jgi:hypothetical protein
MDFVNMVAANNSQKSSIWSWLNGCCAPIQKSNVVSNTRQITSFNTSHSPISWTTALCWADLVESRITVTPKILGVGRVGNPFTNTETLSSTFPVNYLLLVNNNEKMKKRKMLQVRINTLWILYSPNGLYKKRWFPQISPTFIWNLFSIAPSVPENGCCWQWDLVDVPPAIFYKWRCNQILILTRYSTAVGHGCWPLLVH